MCLSRDVWTASLHQEMRLAGTDFRAVARLNLTEEKSGKKRKKNTFVSFFSCIASYKRDLMSVPVLTILFLRFA